MKTLLTLTFVLIFFMNAGFSQDSKNAETGLSNNPDYSKTTRISDLSENKANTNSSQKYHGLIGASWDYTIPTGKFKDVSEYGTQIRFMDFSFFFSKNFGVSGLWRGGSNYARPDMIKVFYSDGIMAGPILSLPVHDKLTFSARALAGYSKNRHIYKDMLKKTLNSSAYMVSMMVRYEILDNVGLFVDGAYYETTSKHYDFLGVNKARLSNIKITNYSIGLGIAYMIPELF